MKKFLGLLGAVIISLYALGNFVPNTPIRPIIKDINRLISEFTHDKAIDVSSDKNNNSNKKADKVIYFPADKYPETAKHIENAISKGKSAVCTIDRDGAENNRSQSLKDVPTKKGYDRDEWPMAFCAEGGSGADIEYITPSDNRGAGSWVSHKLSDYPDGTRVLFTIK
nr:NucA/NucB deoxyribonuclease domain-containing protein [Bacillus velezensis]MDH3104091.1 NucA/NucB deoxyribonuclease domain-containing protein [Bacillus velezensis]MDH3139005.1 NucA/NucB deoxyribonuclease domain-containing protein [Bacillus velezensis]